MAVLISVEKKRKKKRMMTTVSRKMSHRLGGASNSWCRQPSAGYVPRAGKVCRYWISGNCSRNPCRFLHPDNSAPINTVVPPSLKAKQSLSPLKPPRSISKRINADHNLRTLIQKTSAENATDKKARQSCPPAKDKSGSTEKPSVKQNVGDNVKQNGGGAQKPSPLHKDGDTQKPALVEGHRKICEDWINNSCKYGEKCQHLHSWSSANGVSKMAQLEGHQKAVTGINLPSGSDKLFTSSEDGTVRIWNCNTGECLFVAEMGTPVGCLTSEGPWVFAGLTNAVKAWNIETQVELTLNLPAGRVFSLVVCDGRLFAGLQDGSIFVWKVNSDGTSFEGQSLLKEHTGAVVSLHCAANRLYSGSTDKTIRMWDLKTMRCIHTLQKHSDAIMSMVCWERFLLSGSLDKTLKIWAATEKGDVEVTYTHSEQHGILSLCGMDDLAGKPILLCSCNDNSVRLYDLPSFVERGRIFSKQEVRTLHIGPGGLIFTGDGTGAVSVWKCSA